MVQARQLTGSGDDKASGFTAAVVTRAKALATRELTPSVKTVAKQCLLDWVGVSIAGSQEPLVRQLVQQARDEGGHPVATVFRHDARASVRQAALINGAMGHAIDFDDVNIAGHGHVTAATLPAAVATAQSAQRSGSQLLKAFVAGYEAAVMVGRYVGREHYDRGFHATSTVGSFGAATAAAILMDLDDEAFARALGIAGTQAAGLKSQFGTMCKPFHAGKANENGVVGAQLAARGFSSRTDFLECVQGFADVLSPGGDPEAGLAGARDGAHITDNLFKFTAACYSTHGSVAILKQLREAHRFDVRQIRGVHLRVEPAADRICNIPAPRTGLEAKFSLRFNAAAALLGMDTASPDTYSDDATRLGDLCAIRDLVRVEPMAQDWSVTVTEADIELDDGRVLSGRFDTGIPATNLADQGERLTRKFVSLTSSVLGTATAHSLARRIDDVEAFADIGELLAHIQHP